MTRVTLLHCRFAPGIIRTQYSRARTPCSLLTRPTDILSDLRRESSPCISVTDGDAVSESYGCPSSRQSRVSFARYLVQKTETRAFRSRGEIHRGHAVPPAVGPDTPRGDANTVSNSSAPIAPGCPHLESEISARKWVNSPFGDILVYHDPVGYTDASHHRSHLLDRFLNESSMGAHDADQSKALLYLARKDLRSCEAGRQSPGREGVSASPPNIQNSPFPTSLYAVLDRV